MKTHGKNVLACPKEILEASAHCEQLMAEGHFDQGILCAQAVLDTIEERGFVCDPPDVLYHYYRDQRDMGTPTIYMNYIHRLLAYAENHNLEKTLCHGTYYKAYVFYMARQVEDAKVWFEKALVLAHSFEELRIEALTLSNIGNLHYLEGDYYQARRFYLSAIELAEANEMDELKYYRHNLGLAALKIGEYPLALKEMESALAYAIRLNKPYLMANSYSDIGEIYLELGEDERAIAYFEKALSFSGDFITPINLRDTYLSLSKAHAKKADFKEAYDYLLEYNALYTQFAQKQEKDNLARLEQVYILQHWERERALNEELTTSIENLRATQDQLIQTEKRIALNRLVSGIAHNMNTPLGNAISTLSYLQQEYDAPEMALIATSLNRMQALLSLMSESAVSSSDLMRGEVELKSFIDALTNHYYGRETINLTLSGFEVYLNTYPGILERVFMELLSNCIHHSGLEKPIQVFVTIHVDGDTIVISVIDYGKGLSGALIEKAFDPFYTTDMGHYSGLGLYVAKEYVQEILRGELRVKTTEEGRGQCTCFELRLPRWNEK